jgi:hypothetical protein
MKMPMQKGLHIASINTAKVLTQPAHCHLLNHFVTFFQVAMLSKNWQQKADGSAVNWAEVPVVIFFLMSSARLLSEC